MVSPTSVILKGAEHLVDQYIYSLPHTVRVDAYGTALQQDQLFDAVIWHAVLH